MSLDYIKSFFSMQSALDFVDVGLVALSIYAFFRLIRGTRAIYMLMGIVVVIFVYWLSSVLNLYTLNWMLSHLLSGLLFIAVVVFQSEIRRALTRVGRAPIFSFLDSATESRVIEELMKACTSLANKKIGALILIQKKADLSLIHISEPTRPY